MFTTICACLTLCLLCYSLFLLHFFTIPQGFQYRFFMPDRGAPTGMVGFEPRYNYSPNLAKTGHPLKMRINPSPLAQCTQ